MSQRWRTWLLPSLKHIKSIVVRYDPLDPSTRGTREFLFQASNRKLARSNPKCAVTYQLFDDHSPAFIEFTFNNNKLKRLLTCERTVDEITMEMALMVRDMENHEKLGEEEEINEEDEEESKK